MKKYCYLFEANGGRNEGEVCFLAKSREEADEKMKQYAKEYDINKYEHFTESIFEH